MQVVPEIYAPWMVALLGEPVRGEPRSTCEACPMCEGAGAPFRLDVKCCGYLPELANYLVGRELRAAGPGVATLRGRIEDRVAVSPLGLGCPPTWSAAWKEVERTTGFGTDPDLICPHFHAGACRIWANRDAVCSTWFCEVDGGEAGRDFWLVLRSFLQTVERGLSRWAVTELGLDATARPMSWGRWQDDREALFVETAALVEQLAWDDVRQIGGFELRVRGRELRRAAKARRTAIPQPSA